MVKKDNGNAHLKKMNLPSSLLTQMRLEQMI